MTSRTEKNSSGSDVVYLDANATEPLRPQAREALLEAADLTGNPSSVHRAGRKARALLEQARNTVARYLDVAPLNCIFTSGGTEANVLAMRGLGQGRRFLIGRTEHDAVRKGAPEDAHVAWLDVDANGQVRLDKLEQVLAQDETPAFVCLMLANNETGVLHPIDDVVLLCRKYGAHLHVDAVQAAGRLPLSVEKSGIDSLACSGHKMGGPKGAGALLLRGPAPARVLPIFEGGGQEQGRRGGTPPLPAIAGLAAALGAALEQPRDRSRTCKAIGRASFSVSATVTVCSAATVSVWTSMLMSVLHGFRPAPQY